MTKIAELEKKWRKNPKFVEAYESMSDEFALASAVIKARSEAGMTQEELAQSMDAKQSLVARLEAGGQNTTIKTLLRVADATGTQLKISFES